MCADPKLERLLVHISCWFSERGATERIDACACRKARLLFFNLGWPELACDSASVGFEMERPPGLARLPRARRRSLGLPVAGFPSPCVLYVRRRSILECFILVDASRAPMVASLFFRRPFFFEMLFQVCNAMCVSAAFESERRASRSPGFPAL